MTYQAALFFNESLWGDLSDPTPLCVLMYEKIENARAMAKFWSGKYKPGDKFGVRPMYIVRLKDAR
ncbi:MULTISPECIES: hypothetical protein [Bacillati]|uniref:hypothetical protein n=1 Tax=Bacillati TaxID=1783272 RepID=UPI002B2496D6|nr:MULTISPECIES: hypothetical protein [Terrabacteria group]MEB2529373.1 hypothetical protein [Kocuria rosea]MEB2538380.1 hypothetical protein [Micrococcus luteus]MEB2597961.1 hypothetical protein [Corynebacterium amycolatum]MEB2616605.1 hypothetical protein [Bacillus cereus]MEB2620405.1 hypothetical protein [Kocuria rosea]